MKIGRSEYVLRDCVEILWFFLVKCEPTTYLKLLVAVWKYHERGEGKEGNINFLWPQQGP